MEAFVGANSVRSVKRGARLDVAHPKGRVFALDGRMSHGGAAMISNMTSSGVTVTNYGDTITGITVSAHNSRTGSRAHSFRLRSAFALGDRTADHGLHMRPHSSLGYLTPGEFAATIKKHDAAPAQATVRSAAVPGASALRTVASPSHKGQAKGEPRVVVSS